MKKPINIKTVNLTNKIKQHYIYLHTIGDYFREFGFIPAFNLFFGISKLTKLHHPLLKYDFWVRKWTLDVISFRDVIIKKEYELHIDIDPSFIVDLGAGVGDTTSYFATLYPNASVVAIEPEISNFNLLVKNTSKYENVHSINAAIWPKGTPLRITNIDESDKWAFRVAEVTSDSSHYHMVESITMNELLDKFGKKEIDLLKIDIEGTEKELFTTNYSKWLPHTKLILIELHDEFRKGCKKITTDILDKNEFVINFLDDRRIHAYNKAYLDKVGTQL